MIPQGANIRILGLTLWQYLNVLLLLILMVVLHRLLSFLLRNVLIRLVQQLAEREESKKWVQPLARPLSLVVLALIIQNIIAGLGLPVFINRFIFLSLAVFR
ncbi:MAG: hypothetical protein HC880_16905 [Bacteroidia bacterium]|nr:hypothetical protein [Bacteroidia bacterium]